MFDLSKQKIDIKCNCGRKHVATLQDVINSKIIKCFCGSNIKLEDKGNSVKKGVTDINKGLQNLETVFKKLGK